MINIQYIYAFDLSMERSGITIFNENAIPILITSIPTNPKQTHGERLKTIANKVIELRDQYPTNIISIERGFSRFNTSTQVIYRVHGLINYLFCDCEQFYYPPKKVKEAILNGNSTKEQIKNKIKSVYPEIQFTIIETKDKKTKQIRYEECEDESDSFAVGLTYFIKEKGMKWDKVTTKTKKQFKNK